MLKQNPSPSLIIGLLFLIVLSHDQSPCLISALLIKSLICQTTTQNTLVATHVLCHRSEGLNHLQTQLLALFLFPDSNLFNMRNIAKIMNTMRIFSECIQAMVSKKRDLQLPLYHQSPGPNNSTLMLNNQEVVNALSLILHPIIPLAKFLLGDVSGRCQDLNALEESFVVIFSLKRPDLVGFWQGGCDFS
jgi:hypothetical protein